MKKNHHAKDLWQQGQQTIDILEKFIKLKRKQEDRYYWYKHARQNQREPKKSTTVKGVPWFGWLILAGRGFGKTRTGAETIRRWVEKKQAKNLALIGGSMEEVRHIMIEGPSGLRTISPPSLKPFFSSKDDQIVWKRKETSHKTDILAKAYMFNGNFPEKLRGYQFDGAWIDELAKFRDPKSLWDMLLMGLRLGQNPRVIITTTPKPLPFLKDLMEMPGIVVTRGSTFDNKKNLAPSFLHQMEKHYNNTHLGQQEIYAQLNLNQQGSLWKRENIRYSSPYRS